MAVKMDDVLCQLRSGAMVSAFMVDGKPMGVIVDNPGEPPMLYKFDGTREALALSQSGRLIIPVEIDAGASVNLVTLPDHFEIGHAEREIRFGAPRSYSATAHS